MTDRELARKLRNARAAVFALFLTNGALFANIIPRYPEIKDIFGLSESVYGLTIALFPLGSMLFGPFAAMFIRRISSATTAVLGTVIIGVAFTLVGVFAMWRESLGADASGWLPAALYFAFVATFFLGGASDSITDVGQNAHGLRVQRLMGRPIINSFHAGWSVGAVLGGLTGALAVALEVPLGWHLGIASLTMVVVGMVARRFALPGADPARGETDPIFALAGTVSGGREAVAVSDVQEMRVHTLSWRNPWLVVAMLTGLCIAGMLVEDGTFSWSVLYMRDYLSVGGGLAGSAFIVMLALQAIGRFSADKQMELLGARWTVQLGGLLVAVGMGLAVIFQNAPMLWLGMALTGFGCAGMVPIAMNAADDIPGLRPGTGLTVVTWLGRLAFLCAPPLVGLLVEQTSLLSAMIVIPVAGVVAAVTAQVIAPRGGEVAR